MSTDIYTLHGRNIIESHISRLLGSTLNPIILEPPKPVETFSEVIPGRKPLAILGGGVGGLYTAMILQSLGLPFEIFEAKEDVGGRLLTHHFQGGPYDYFDIGAMRFPRTAVMRRTFELFEGPQLNPHGDDFKKKLIPYNFRDNNTFLHYNGVRVRRSQFSEFHWKTTGADPNLVQQGSDAVMKNVLKPFVDLLWQDLKNKGHAGWDNLMLQDGQSTRGYLSQVKHMSYQTINWLETMNGATGGFERAFAETVLASMHFGLGNPGGDPEWKCIDGGSNDLAQAMKHYILKHAPNSLRLKQQVSALKVIAGIGSVTSMEVHVRGIAQPERYGAVISTLPLPASRALDMDHAGLSIFQTNALRQLRYEPSLKIGVKFKSDWWKNWKTLDNQPIDIRGGQSSTDRPLRTVVYPSHGLGTPTPSTVLMASYPLNEDASRIGGLMGGFEVNPEFKEQLKEIVIRDLANIHNVSVTALGNEYEDMYAWDWSAHPLTQGAFAFFGPQQFSGLYTNMTVPAPHYRLFFAGEAVSPRHGWVVGALDSAVRAVSQYLKSHHPELVDKFKELWGSSEEWKCSEDFRKGDDGREKETFSKIPKTDDDLLLIHMATMEWLQNSTTTPDHLAPET